MPNEINLYAADGLPYIPKVVSILPEELTHLYRWRQTDFLQEEASCTRESVIENCASVTFILNTKALQRYDFRQIVNNSGWLVFGLLSVKAIPRIQYLVHAAASYQGDWIDGLALESIFDSATSVTSVRPPSRDFLHQLDFGLDCSRQMSMAHWQTVRRRLVSELEGDVSELYVDNISKFERGLKHIRSNLQKEQSSKSRRLLNEARTSLRAALLDVESKEADVAQFMIHLNTELPAYELKKLFTLEWSVEPKTEAACSKLASRIRSK